jgi:hypothetical protein
MSKLPATPNNLKQHKLKQPSPDNGGLDKHKQETADLNSQAAQVNRDTDELAKHNPVTANELSKKSTTNKQKLSADY